MGLGIVEMVLLMEEAGYALLPGPLFSTLMAGAVLLACGSEAQQQKYLAKICNGQARATVAFLEEDSNWNSAELKMSATASKLNGKKYFVTDAAVADFMLVVTSGDVYVMDAKASGMKITPMKGIDLASRCRGTTG